MVMTTKERLLKVLAGEIPDCVPACPDMSNMIPARLTGKPFWDLYLYNDPPLWQAYIDCAKHFDIDSLMDTFPLVFDYEKQDSQGWESFIVFKTPERIVTQSSRLENGKREWSPTVNVYYKDNPPNWNMPVEKASLPAEPERFEPVEGVKDPENGPEGLKKAKQLMGDQGLVGAFVTYSLAWNTAEGVYNYYDNPDKHEQWASERIAAAEKRFAHIMAMEVRPDFLCVGASGTLVFQTVDIFRQLTYPAVKRVIELATEAGIPTHVHSCGPEKQLVKIFAEETNLTVIDPLEIPPMGNCDLAELKKLYGNKIVLKGNLHTTNVMLNGSVDDVIAASKKAIDDAAAGGRFILATGDQCGRDTPDENITAMVETARTYGKY